MTATLWFVLTFAALQLRKSEPIYQLLGFWCLGMFGLVLAPFFNSESENSLQLVLHTVMYTLSNSVPLSSLFLFYRLFEEEIPKPAWIAAIAVLGILIDSVDYAISQFGNWPNTTSGIYMFEYAPQVVKIGLVLLCFYVLVRSWSVDLVVARYRIRHLIVLLGLLIGFEMLVVENLIGIRVVVPYDPSWFHLIWQSLIGISLLAVLFQPTPSLWFTRLAGEPLKELPHGLNSPEVQRLNELLEVDIFRDPDLSIRTLAQQMRLTEQRTRQLINTQLGYKNFNAFVNDQRIAVACEDLKDPTRQALPILTIALDAGFGSIASFNRAFRKRHDMPPTQYRARKSSCFQNVAPNK